MIQGRKRWAVLAVLFVVLFSGCYFSSTGSSYFQLQLSQLLGAGSVGGQMISGGDIENKNVAAVNYLRSVFSFTRMEQEGRSGRTESRTYFNSIFAVLFKIAVIPGITYMTALAVNQSRLSALHRMIRFVHDSDGKKGRKAFLPA